MGSLTLGMEVRVESVVVVLLDVPKNFQMRFAMWSIGEAVEESFEGLGGFYRTTSWVGVWIMLPFGALFVMVSESRRIREQKKNRS